MCPIDREHSALGGAVVFVAMELSKSAWLLALQGSPSGKTASHRLEGGDIDGLLALLRHLQGRERQACGGGHVQIVVGYEAGYDGFWLQRRLASEGIICWVMDPGSLQVDRRARRAKTDRLDAAMLLRALMAWCRGDRAACRMVQVPSVEREDARRTHRERQRLITERVRHVNRIKGLLATQGVYEFRPLRRDRWARLGELRTGDGRELPAYAGLTPSLHASGDRSREQGISKAGNPLLRKAMVELAWLWLRYQPGSARGRVRKIAAVALARKLLVALWRYVTTGLVPDGAADGAQRTARSSSGPE